MANGSASGPIPTPRRTSARAAETAARRARLLRAAIELAGEGGYDAVQMRDVAARAEVALGTLYRHYASKDQLLLAAMEAQAERLRQRLDQKPPSGASPRERVADALTQACRALERQPQVTAAMVRAMFSSDDNVAPTKARVRDALEQIIANAVGDDPVDDLDGVIDVLGRVWLATMAAWAGGTKDDGPTMGETLTRAAHLVVR